MFSFLTPYKSLIEIGLVLTIIGGLIYGVYATLAYERELGYQNAVAEYTAKQLLAEIDARDKKAKYDKQVQEAQNAANLRDQEIKKLSATLAVTTHQLRNTVAALHASLPTIPLDAARKTAATALTVFDECRAEYSTLAENATGHSDDIITLEQTWIKND